mmetsp:Transcript_24702/g.82858  ORF Transcript_24702/g.82858 Transcript_24702/m.82858 type:complete len:244 (+) Transcript_24702:677-1408(+)
MSASRPVGHSYAASACVAGVGGLAGASPAPAGPVGAAAVSSTAQPFSFANSPMRASTSLSSPRPRSWSSISRWWSYAASSGRTALGRGLGARKLRAWRALSTATSQSGSGRASTAPLSAQRLATADDSMPAVAITEMRMRPAASIVRHVSVSRYSMDAGRAASSRPPERMEELPGARRRRLSSVAVARESAETQSTRRRMGLGWVSWQVARMSTLPSQRLYQGPRVSALKRDTSPSALHTRWR